ncbi:hypothetical protein D3C87_1890200 [compost metagenome]
MGTAQNLDPIQIEDIGQRVTRILRTDVTDLDRRVVDIDARRGRADHRAHAADGDIGRLERTGQHERQTRCLRHDIGEGADALPVERLLVESHDAGWHLVDVLSSPVNRDDDFFD